MFLLVARCRLPPVLVLLVALVSLFVARVLQGLELTLDLQPLICRSWFFLAAFVRIGSSRCFVFNVG